MRHQRIGIGWRGLGAATLPAWLLLCVQPMPVTAQITIADQIIARQKVIAGTTTASASPLTVVGLAGGGPILRIGAGGAVTSEALAIGDIPSVFTRRDVAEPISGLWSFNGGTLSFGHGVANWLMWPTAGVNTPTLTTRSVGTRAVLFPSVTGTEFDYALGLAGATFWSSVNATGGRFAWFASDGDSNTEPADQDLVAELTGSRNFLPGQTYSGQLGLLNRKWLSLHAAELWVETLVAQNTIATIGGRVLVGPTTTLTADLAAAATGILTKHNNLVVGDTVYLEGNGQFEMMVVGFGPIGSGPYGYEVFRNRDGSGANAWLAGDAVFNTGQVGTGWIDLYALASMKGGTEAGPTIVGNVRTANTDTGTGANYNAWAPRWAVGNLQGLYGYSSATYGSAFGDPNAVWVATDATNGFRVMRAGSVAGQWDTAGVITIGSAAANETGKITIDGDSIDMQYRNAGGALTTPFWISGLSGNAIASFDADLYANAGVRTSFVRYGSGNLTIQTTGTSSHIILAPFPAGGTVQPGADGAHTLGTATKRWGNIHLYLPIQSGSVAPPSGFPYLVTGDTADPTRLGYFCGTTGTLHFSVPGASCPSTRMSMTLQCGVTTGIACLP